MTRFPRTRWLFHPSIPEQRGEKPRRVNDNVSTPLPFGPTLRPELLSLFYSPSTVRLHNKINTVTAQRPNILRPSNYPTRTASFTARDIPSFDRFRTVFRDARFHREARGYNGVVTEEKKNSAKYRTIVLGKILGIIQS